MQDQGQQASTSQAQSVQAMYMPYIDIEGHQMDWTVKKWLVSQVLEVKN